MCLKWFNDYHEKRVENHRSVTGRSFDSQKSYFLCKDDFQFQDIYSELFIPLYIYPAYTEYNPTEIFYKNRRFSLFEFISLSYQELREDYMYFGNFLCVDYFLTKYVSPLQSYFVLSSFYDGSASLSLYNGDNVKFSSELLVGSFYDFEEQSPPLDILELKIDFRTVGDLCCYEYYNFLQIRKYDAVTANGKCIEFLSYNMLLLPPNELIIYSYRTRMNQEGITILDEGKQTLYNNSHPDSVLSHTKSVIQYGHVNYQYTGLNYPMFYQRFHLEVCHLNCWIQSSEILKFSGNEECQTIVLKESKHLVSVARHRIGRLKIGKIIYLKERWKGEPKNEKYIYIRIKRRRKGFFRVIDEPYGLTEKTFISLLHADPWKTKINYYEPPVEDWDDAIDSFWLELEKRKRGYMFNTFDFQNTKDSREERYFLPYNPECSISFEGDVKNQFYNLFKSSYYGFN